MKLAFAHKSSRSRLRNKRVHFASRPPSIVAPLVRNSLFDKAAIPSSPNEEAEYDSSCSPWSAVPEEGEADGNPHDRSTCITAPSSPPASQRSRLYPSLFLSDIDEDAGTVSPSTAYRLLPDGSQS